MHAQRWQHAKQIFRQALDLPAHERGAFIAAQCDDESLRGEVARLLELHDDASEFLKTPLESASDPMLGRNLGGFTILRRVGVGGMGAVYEAGQERPKRKAAVKVLRPGFATRGMMRRFEYESEILAKLQHPGIAHIYAAGTFDIGGGAQPWFAMELIDGEPLHDYCARQSVSRDAKLKLLISICDAVQHAHQRGVIHRDLKPANVMVDRTTTSAQPKILDFGVARSVDAELHATMHTTAGELVGTLSYMSPEQLSGAEVDARCDVYALGAIGYELLSGRLPHQPNSGAVTELIRAIEQDEPAKLGSADPSLRGDLEVIFAKALEKDVARRYQSAAEFAGDLRRFLNHEPVLARPATAMYQLRKFARRNRALVGGVVATILALATGLVMYSIQAREARREAARSRYEADKAVAINNFITNDFLMQLLGAVKSRGNDDLSIAALLDQAAANVATIFAGQPLAEAAVRNEIGTIYYNVGAPGKSAEQFQIALDRWEAQLGPDHPDTLKAVNNLGQALMRQRRPAEAEPLYRRALESRRRVLGADDPFTLVSMNNLAELYRATDRMDDAEGLLREAVASLRRVQGDTHKNTITTMTNLGSLLNTRGKTGEALELQRAAYAAARKTFGDDHVTTLTTATRLGQTLTRADQLEDAETLLVQTVELLHRTRGDGAGETIFARRALARAYIAKHDRAQAEVQLRLAIQAAELQPDGIELVRDIQRDLNRLPATSQP